MMHFLSICQFIDILIMDKTALFNTAYCNNSILESTCLDIEAPPISPAKRPRTPSTPTTPKASKRKFTIEFKVKEFWDNKTEEFEAVNLEVHSSLRG